MTLTFIEGLHYNDRIIKPKLTTPADYQAAGYTVLSSIINIDFVPQDGVITSQVINYDESMDDLFRGVKEASYVIVYDEDTGYTHWWVIESRRNRLGQYTITLLRDIVKDYYDVIGKSMLFVEKGTVKGQNNLVFNNEGMTFNQIKTDETLLTDKTGIPWLVGYIDKEHTIEGSLPKTDTPYAKITSSFGSWYKDGDKILTVFNTAYLNYYSKQNGTGTTYEFGTGYIRNSGTYPATRVMIDEAEPNSRFNNTSLYLSGSTKDMAAQVNNAIQITNTSGLTAAIDTIAATDTRVKSSSDLQELLALNNQYVQDINGEVRFFSITKITGTSISFPFSSGALFEIMSNVAAASQSVDGKPLMGGVPNINSFELITQHPQYQISLTKTNLTALPYSLGERIPTIDAPYDMFCIPYGEITITDENGATILTTEKDLGMTLARSISLMGSEAVYDMQLLPYCPVPQYIDGSKKLKITNQKKYISTVVEAGKTSGSAIIYCPKTVFTFDINYYNNGGITDANNPLETKVSNDCNFYRLASPNYANYFDFSIAKNGGLSTFNVDCAYKPYSPYIHINPVFGRMYGSDFNDARGLILGGDFSLTSVNDKWQTYELNNKYYQQTFDRQIQNMETVRGIQRGQEITSAAFGAVSGAAQGAVVGGMMGGPIGAGIGAAVGGIASAAGGAQDIYYNDKLHQENLKYAKDQFSYQLQTIQAMPQTISKVSSYNPNNKIFPVFEKYTCSAEEKTAYIRKLCYEGMTIMSLGKLSDYTGSQYTMDNETTRNYIKARIVKLADKTAIDSHIYDTLQAELSKGVYIL